MKKKVRVYKSPDGNGKYINKTAKYLDQMQDGGQPTVDQLSYPGAQQEAQATSEEQLMQLVYQDISNDMPYEAIVAKLVNGYNLDPAVANQFVQQVYSVIENKIDKDKSEEAEEEEESPEVKDVEQEILSEKKPMSKIKGHNDLAMEETDEDLTDLEDEDMLRYGGTPRYQRGGEQEYVEAMNNDQIKWPAAETPIVMPDVSDYIPFDMSEYLENNAAEIAWQEPTEDLQQVVSNEEDIDYSEPIVNPEEFKFGGFKTKKGYVNSVMKLVKKQMGGDDKEQNVKASDADPRGADLRKNRLDAFLNSVKNEGNISIAKEQAEEQFDQMKAMHEQMMMQQAPMQQFIPEDYEGIDEMQFGGQQRRAMRRMNRALRKMPLGIPGMVGPVTKYDVHRTGIFGGPKEYTIEFGESPLMQLAANPLLANAYGYGYKTKTTKTPGKLITEKVRNTINNESTKQVANATKSEAAAKSAWDLDQNTIPDSIQSNIIESKAKSNLPEWINDPIGTAITRSKLAPKNCFPQQLPDGTVITNCFPRKGINYQEGGLVNNPMQDQFGNLQRFIGGGFDPSIPSLTQGDIDDVYSKDTTDPYMPQAQYGGGLWGALVRNYVPANFPQRYSYSQMVRPAYNKATGQQFAGVPGFNPYAQVKDIQVTKTGMFGRPKKYTVTYNNNPSGKPEDRKLAYRDPAASQQGQQKQQKEANKSTEPKAGYSNTAGLSASAQRQIAKGERQMARNERRAERNPEGNVPFMFNTPGKGNDDNVGLGTKIKMLGAKLSGPDQKQYGGDLSRFLPEALLGNETPVSMANNPANSNLKMPIKSSKEVGQELMTSSKKKLEEEANYQPDEYSVDYKTKNKWLGDNQGAILTTNAALQGVAGFVDRMKNKKREAKMYENLTADNLYASDPSRDRGDYEINSGLYRPDEQGQTWGSRSAQYGGSSDYSEGAVVDMTEEELAEFLANGGQVEYL